MGNCHPRLFFADHATIVVHSPHALHAVSPLSSPAHHKSHFDPYPPALGPPSSYPASHHSRPYPMYHSENLDSAEDSKRGILSSPATHNSPRERSATPVSANNPAGAYYSPSAYEGGGAGGGEGIEGGGDGDRSAESDGYTHDLRHQLQQRQTPEPMSPLRPPLRAVAPSAYGPKVIQWTPQQGDEGTQVVIVLDPLAIRNAPSTASSDPFFGPGSPSLASPSSQSSPITRRFAVFFGLAPAPTKLSRANTIDGNGVGTSMTTGPDEADAFVILTTFVPPRQAMGAPSERIMVLVQILDENSSVLEETVVGEWESLLPGQRASFRRLLAGRPC